METIKVGVSNHHIHLTEKDLFTLFGEGYKLTNKRDLVQKGQFACEETVTLERDGKILEHIRIIGPCRSYTQVELLDRDNEYFGIKAPVRTSGDLAGSEWINIIGPVGSVHALESTIVADRHIHMSAEDLVSFGVEKGQTVKVRYENGVVLDDVHIKSDPTCVLELHMNKDEAESLGIETGMSVEIC
jgi:putative phosphotransacetylase